MFAHGSGNFSTKLLRPQLTHLVRPEGNNDGVYDKETEWLALL